MNNGDKLLLRGMIFHGYHGFYQEEQKLGQKFIVDADVWTDLSTAGQSDMLQDSISYAEIYTAIKGIVEGAPKLLLETIATSIANDLFEKFPRIYSLRVRVKKPHVAVEGVVEYLGVEILRENPNHINVTKN